MKGILMVKARKLLVAATAGVALSTGAVGTAQAAPSTASVSVAASSTVHATFNLLVANDPVTFTVDGEVVGSGVTDADGDVSFVLSTAGMAAGYYRLVAASDSGPSSSVGFSVR